METFRIKKPVRLVGVSVSNLVKGEKQLPLFERDRKRERLLSATDRINDRFGEFTVSSGLVLIEKKLSSKCRACHGFIKGK